MFAGEIFRFLLQVTWNNYRLNVKMDDVSPLLPTV